MLRSIAVLLFMATTALAQRDSAPVSVDGVEIRLGMPRDQVFALFGDQFQVSEMQDANNAANKTWKVAPKNVESGSEISHVLQFDSQDRLVSINKDLGSASGDEAALILSTLFAELRLGDPKGNPALKVRVSGKEEIYKRTRYRFILFEAGNRQYHLAIVQPIGQSSSPHSSIALSEYVTAGKSRRPENEKRDKP